MTALSHEGCSPEAINVACAERLPLFVWTTCRCGTRRVLLRASHPALKDALAGCDMSLPIDPEGASHIPNFHGSLDAAMQLVERAREMGWLWMSDNLVKQGDVFTVFFKNKSSAHHASAPKPAAAICEAFLKLPEAGKEEG